MSMIVFFSYFYASLIINPVDMSQNLKKMGASIPGIRPGKATSQYIDARFEPTDIAGCTVSGCCCDCPNHC